MFIIFYQGLIHQRLLLDRYEVHLFLAILHDHPLLVALQDLLFWHHLLHLGGFLFTNLLDLVADVSMSETAIARYLSLFLNNWCLLLSNLLIFDYHWL